MVKIKLNKKRKVLIALLVMAAIAVAMVWYFTPGEYLSVSDVVDHPSKYEGKTIDIRGTVEKGTLDNDGRMFNITDDKASLPVISDGKLPDNLKEGKDCVVRGKLEVNGEGELEFHATEITVGCPSKYE